MAVVIIGAGITGLAAAFELAERRVPFVVLEASHRAGGLILTEKIDGFTIEAGPDAILAQKPAGLQLCEELGLGPRLIATMPPRRAYVLAGGRLYALPTPSVLGIPTGWRALAHYDLLSWRARARLALEPLVLRRTDGADESVASFFRRRFGPDTARLIAAPLLGGIHAGDIEDLSVRSLFPRLTDAESRKGSVLLSLRRVHPPAAEGAFRSLSPGMGELISALARRLGEKILYNRRVTALRREHESWSVACDSQTFRAHAIVVAVPAHAAAQLLGPVDTGAARLCAAIPYASTASVSLAWPRAEVPHPLEGSGFVVARTPGAPRITACTWVSSKFEGRAPAGWALLRAFIGGVRDPDAVSMSDDMLVATAARDVSAVLGIGTPPQLARVYRWLDAGAQHNVGHLAKVEQIEARLSRAPGLVVAGSGFRSIGIPDCISDGRAAGVAVAGYVAAAARARL